jgi:hypothetical protein
MNSSRPGAFRLSIVALGGIREHRRDAYDTFRLVSAARRWSANGSADKICLQANCLARKSRSKPIVCVWIWQIRDSVNLKQAAISQMRMFS